MWVAKNVVECCFSPFFSVSPPPFLIIRSLPSCCYMESTCGWMLVRTSRQGRSDVLQDTWRSTRRGWWWGDGGRGGRVFWVHSFLIRYSFIRRFIFIVHKDYSPVSALIYIWVIIYWYGIEYNYETSKINHRHRQHCDIVTWPNDWTPIQATSLLQNLAAEDSLKYKSNIAYRELIINSENNASMLHHADTSIHSAWQQ